MITQDLLKEHFEYRDGHLWWIKPLAYQVKVGSQAGCVKSDGYIRITILGIKYYEHRLVWLYHYGEWPKDQLDHINGIRDDNRIENLREATRQQNSFNKKSFTNSTSKYKGVHWSTRDKVWRAQRTLNKKTIYLGSFQTEEDAAEAYRRATVKIHGEYSNYG